RPEGNSPSSAPCVHTPWPASPVHDTGADWRPWSTTPARSRGFWGPRTQEEERSVAILGVAIPGVGQRLPEQDRVLRLTAVEQAQAPHIVVGGVIVRSGDAAAQEGRKPECDAQCRERTSHACFTPFVHRF